MPKFNLKAVSFTYKTVTGEAVEFSIDAIETETTIEEMVQATKNTELITACIKEVVKELKEAFAM